MAPVYLANIKTRRPLHIEPKTWNENVHSKNRHHLSIHNHFKDKCSILGVKNCGTEAFLVIINEKKTVRV